MLDMPSPKPLIWVGSSRKDFQKFPDEVKSDMGYALFMAQCGGRHRKAKTLSGFGGAGVVEIIGNHCGDTFRTVYSVRFAAKIYVLHAFQKKSKSGIKTPPLDLRTINRRLKEAEHLEKGGTP